MKLITLFAALAGVCLLVAGCKKEEAAPPVPQGGIDMPKLNEALSTASAEAKAALADVQFGIRYNDYPKALQALNKLAATSGLTDAQKKAINDMIEQVKTAIAKPPGT
jgi:hypothetical protein